MDDAAVVRGSRGAQALLAAWPALLPALVALSLRPVAAAGTAGVFQCGLAGLVVLATLGAFATPTWRRALQRLPAAALGLALVHLALAGRGAPEAFLLALAVGGAASGLAALGRAVGAPAAPSALVATAVLAAAMSGLRWADAVAERLPGPARPRFRQAVLHADPALAYAYGAAGHEWLQEPAVYARYPLASFLLERPAAWPAAVVWLAVGALAWSAAVLLGPGSGRAGGGGARRRGRGEQGGKDAGAHGPPPADAI